MSARRWFIGISVCLATLSTTTQAQVTEDNFQLRTTGDLVSLCSASPSEAMGTAALNFCHGFAVGVYRVLQQQQMASRPPHLFCAQSPTTSRNQAIAEFVQWAKASPNVLSQPPADGIAAYLVHKFPCPRGK